jgi:hypothetical protein
MRLQYISFGLNPQNGWFGDFSGGVGPALENAGFQRMKCSMVCKSLGFKLVFCRFKNSSEYISILASDPGEAIPVKADELRFTIESGCMSGEPAPISSILENATSRCNMRLKY